MDNETHDYTQTIVKLNLVLSELLQNQDDTFDFCSTLLPKINEIIEMDSPIEDCMQLITSSTTNQALANSESQKEEASKEIQSILSMLNELSQHPTFTDDKILGMITVKTSAEKIEEYLFSVISRQQKLIDATMLVADLAEENLVTAKELDLLQVRLKKLDKHYKLKSEILNLALKFIDSDEMKNHPQQNRLHNIILRELEVATSYKMIITENISILSILSDNAKKIAERLGAVYGYAKLVISVTEKFNKLLKSSLHNLNEDSDIVAQQLEHIGKQLGISLPENISKDNQAQVFSDIMKAIQEKSIALETEKRDILTTKQKAFAEFGVMTNAIKEQIPLSDLNTDRSQP